MGRILVILLYAIVAAGVVWFLVGLARFPDAPIRPCAVDQFCGKLGQPHTKADYDAFRVWQTSLLLSWPVVLVAAGVLAWLRRKS